MIRISHVNVTMPRGGGKKARAFYGRLLGLKEIPHPKVASLRGAVWFDVGGQDVHLTVEDPRTGPDAHRHFALACTDLRRMRARLERAGFETKAASFASGRRFFVSDPFGNRVEIHDPAWPRA